MLRVELDGFGADGDESPAGGVDVIEAPAVGGALHEQRAGVG